ncbi:hypothetical protein QBZ16_005471 [Prototheca wickerhamii]|uniref:Protein kinase domain-containing protein n=1 Tax=Prototheca wickerhamii TaxID=3111 RepID=A0AAD9MMC9_PROWI|nr:hypothetical protein QBZ16_005471 [Prototheca wickerhamii]
MGTPFPKVSAWILDKSLLTHGEGGSRDERALASFLEHCKHEAKALARLRHPGILRVISPIEELRSQLVFVTEAVECSLGGYLAAGLKDAAVSRMSELEVKHGLLQLAGAIAFLHGEAGLVHRGICPQAAFVAASGGWKLASMGFAAPIGAAPPAGAAVFDYSGNAISPLLLAIKPALAYTPPELVATTTVHVGSAGPSTLSDAFSFGLLAAELFSNCQVLAVSSSVAAYDAALRGMSPERDLRGVPSDLQALVEGLLALEPAQRCPVETFASSPVFQNDRPLRALRFLEDLLQKSLAEKSAFFRDLSRLLPHMDARVQLRLVLPPVLSELETGTEPALLAELVPLVLRLSAAQSAQDRAASTLPALASLARRASGPALLALVEAAPELQRELAPADAARLVPGLLARALAADGGGGAPTGPDARLAALQERAACVAAALAPEGLDGQALRATLVPAARRLCLATTSAPVRVACFELLAAAGPRLDARETRASLETAVQVAAVDRSAPTAAALGALGVAAARQQGPELAAELVLPTLSPLLVAPTLTRAQRAGILRAVRATLAVIEAGAIAEAGARPELPGVASSARSQASRSSTPDPKPSSTGSKMGGAWAHTVPTAHTAPIVSTTHTTPSAPTAHADTASRLFDPGLPKDAAPLIKPLRSQPGNVVGTWSGQGGMVPGQREGSTMSSSIKTPSNNVGMTKTFQGMGLGNGHPKTEPVAAPKPRNPGGPLDEDFWVQSQAPALSGPGSFSQPTTEQLATAQDPADPFGPLSTLIVQKPGSTNGNVRTSAQGSLI